MSMSFVFLAFFSFFLACSILLCVFLLVLLSCSGKSWVLALFISSLAIYFLCAMNDSAGCRLLLAGPFVSLRHGPAANSQFMGLYNHSG